MFNSEGWKYFQEDVDDQLNPRVEHATDACPTNDLWQYARGEIAILRQIKGYQNLIEATEAQMEEEDASL